jgi:ribose transport system permease protein
MSTALSRGGASLFGKFAPAISLVVVTAFFYAVAPEQPLSVLDARFILLQTVIVGLVALGMTIVIVSGGIDLSVGSAVALAGVAAAKVMATGESSALAVLAIAAAATVGVACGVYNGVLVTVLRLPPFIVTLGTLGFFRGVAKWISGSSPVYSKAGWLAAWVEPAPSIALLVVAPAVWVMVLIAGAVALVLKKTVVGRQAVAIGSNEEAARRAGIPIARVKVGVYAACGLLVGLAGVVQFARLGGSGDPTVQIGLELKAIAAVVIGGASFAGGYASVTGTLCGALLMVLLENRCTAVGWPNYVQELVVGHIIIAAVAVDQWRRRRGSAA